MSIKRPPAGAGGLIIGRGISSVDIYRCAIDTILVYPLRIIRQKPDIAAGDGAADVTGVFLVSVAASIIASAMDA